MLVCFAVLLETNATLLHCCVLRTGLFMQAHGINESIAAIAPSPATGGVATGAYCCVKQHCYACMSDQ
jgi:hypothetical protein